MSYCNLGSSKCAFVCVFDQDGNNFLLFIPRSRVSMISKIVLVYLRALLRDDLYANSNIEVLCMSFDLRLVLGPFLGSMERWSWHIFETSMTLFDKWLAFVRIFRSFFLHCRIQKWFGKTRMWNLKWQWVVAVLSDEKKGYVRVNKWVQKIQ